MKKDYYDPGTKRVLGVFVRAMDSDTTGVRVRVIEATSTTNDVKRETTVWDSIVKPGWRFRSRVRAAIGAAFDYMTTIKDAIDLTQEMDVVLIDVPKRGEKRSKKKSKKKKR